ncbi:uncharacterized protein [Argopecten irradians]|uniref:uncharacterized protein n=1 Tax=Argopecten irradians TaxID=31199 RepID=UPI0037152AA6
MASRRNVLVLGHSFISRLSRYVNELPSRSNLGLQYDSVRFTGLPGGSINRIVREFSRSYRESHFDLVCLQCGGNDLSSPSADPESVVRELCAFVDWLLDIGGVRKVAVCKLFFRASTRTRKGDVSVEVYNDRVSQVNSLLAEHHLPPKKRRTAATNNVHAPEPQQQQANTASVPDADSRDLSQEPERGTTSITEDR